MEEEYVYASRDETKKEIEDIQRKIIRLLLSLPDFEE